MILCCSKKTDHEETGYFMTKCWKTWLIGLSGSLLLRAVNRTLRWDYVGLDGEDRYWANGKPCILVFWHGRQLFMPWIYLRHRSAGAPRMTALISQHSDGRMIAEGMRRLGIYSVAGSSSRGGLRALHSLSTELRSNSHIAITPDGPKGPIQKVKGGVLAIAQRTGAAIVPAAFSAEHRWQFKSWDGMIFPKPFSRAVMIKGRPIYPDDTDGDVDRLTEMVEAALNDVTLRADNYFLEKAGRAPSSVGLGRTSAY
jgi:lysophospholipid acyltransferase (LPLAT)-like uncharacterized protein